MARLSFLSNSPQQTQAIAAEFAQELKAGEVVALVGPLGAGKTVFARGLCAGLGSQDLVSSPSFTLVNLYQGPVKINHVDLYRLENSAEIEDLDPSELFYPSGVTIIEWAEKARSRLPVRYHLVCIRIINEHERQINIYDSSWPDEIC